MKWPLSITLVRHGQSTYNALRAKKLEDTGYQEFCKEFERGNSERLKLMAKAIQLKFALNVSDCDTPLSGQGILQAETTGKKLSEIGIPVPDVIFTSPYLRTKQTLEAMIKGGFNGLGAKHVVEDRIREQEHGLSLLYNDWRIFHALHPEQREFEKLMGPYWYQYPQGESVSMVRSRVRSFTDTLIREYASKHVVLVTHHLTILSIRANYERLSPEEFIRLDREQKPVNCGITVYRGNPHRGTRGKLELEYYNKKLY